jgi:multiple sugar transport system permease protein
MTEVLTGASREESISAAQWGRRISQVSRLFGRTLLVVICTAGSLLYMIPFVWMLSTSVKPGYQIFIMPPVWIPAEFHFENYVEPWSKFAFLSFYKNTLTIVALNIIGTVCSSSLVAYAFARMRFPGRNVLFLVLLSTMMLPTQVTLIPRYVLFAKLKWVDSLKPLIIPTYFGSAFNIFLLRQYFMTIHLELDDAARIDGCGYFGTFRRILLPLSRPALGVVAVFTFTSNWNAFIGPLIYLNNPKNFTIALGLRMFQTHYDVEMQHTMAMTVVSIVPVLILFFFAQRHFIQGIVLTGVKG